MRRPYSSKIIACEPLFQTYCCPPALGRNFLLYRTYGCPSLFLRHERPCLMKPESSPLAVAL